MRKVRSKSCLQNTNPDFISWTNQVLSHLFSWRIVYIVMKSLNIMSWSAWEGRMQLFHKDALTVSCAQQVGHQNSAPLYWFTQVTTNDDWNANKTQMTICVTLLTNIWVQASSRSLVQSHRLHYNETLMGLNSWWQCSSLQTLRSGARDMHRLLTVFKYLHLRSSSLFPL